MAKIESAFLDIGYIDSLANQDSMIHQLDPRAKVLTTFVFIVAIISFHPYSISGLAPFFLYPALMLSLGNLPAIYLMKKVIIALPFVIFIGIFNPFFDTAILMQIGGVPISGGWISFLSMLIRFTLTVVSALILIASTGFNATCMALEQLGVPKVFAVQLLFLYRYIFVLVEEALRMARARALRSFSGNGMGIKIYGHLIGHLLLRTLDRANRIHLAMFCRGFDGTIRIARHCALRPADIWFAVGCSSLFILLRIVNLPILAGNLITRCL